MFPQFEFSHFSFSTYFLILSFTFSAAILAWNHVIERFQLPRDFAWPLSFWILVGSLLGARSFHVFFEEWALYKAHPWWILRLDLGGFVFYGGFVGAVVFATTFWWIWNKRHSQKQGWLTWANRLAPFVSIGYLVGRFGCFLNGCCYGALTNVPWSVDHRHPTQLYAVASEFLISGFLFRRPKNLKGLFESPRSSDKQTLFFKWLALHSAARIVMEIFRDDDRGRFLLGFSQATWISGFFLILSAYFVLTILPVATEVP